MSDDLGANAFDRIEPNSRMGVEILSLAEQASDTTRPVDRVIATLRQALAADAVGLAWTSPHGRRIWYLEADCGDPGLAAELKAIKCPRKWAVVRHALQTGQALRIDEEDGVFAPAFFSEAIRTRHLAALPIHGPGGIHAVALIVNLKDQSFDALSLRVLKMVCACLALRLENVNLVRELSDATARVANFNLVKDRVIQRFSHELKTPLAVLIACVKLLQHRMVPLRDAHSQAVLARARRSLRRLLDLEYELEDILRAQDEGGGATLPVSEVNASDGQTIKG
jgi:transcriptional regulator with GAF, ATPase, and Fis domain